MKNVEFKNRELKKIYKSLELEYPGLASVMNMLLLKDNVIVEEINGDGYNPTIVILLGKKLINIHIDYLKNKIYVISSSKSYSEIYDNYPKQEIKPIGYEYHNNGRLIFRKNIQGFEEDEFDNYCYDIFDNGKNYSVIINDYDGSFDNELFVQKLLYSHIKYNSIREIFILILNEFNNSFLDIVITDAKGSVIVIKKGEIAQYIEYQENNNEYQKITLEDGEFFIEKRVKEVYEDNLTSLIKKLGECNGKEKR